jgi:hypothetical protein
MTQTEMEITRSPGIEAEIPIYAAFLIYTCSFRPQNSVTKQSEAEVPSPVG